MTTDADITSQPIIDPSPRRAIPVGKSSDPIGTGVYLFEQYKHAPKGPVADLVAIGPLAVNIAVRAIIEANVRLARVGMYFSVVPTSKTAERRSVPYEESQVTALVLILQVMD